MRDYLHVAIPGVDSNKRKKRIVYRYYKGGRSLLVFDYGWERYPISGRLCKRVGGSPVPNLTSEV